MVPMSKAPDMARIRRRFFTGICHQGSRRVPQAWLIESTSEWKNRREAHVRIRIETMLTLPRAFSRPRTMLQRSSCCSSPMGTKRWMVVRAVSPGKR